MEKFNYKGRIYVRPDRKGVVLMDIEGVEYLEDQVPSAADYNAEIKITDCRDSGGRRINWDGTPVTRTA